MNNKFIKKILQPSVTFYVTLGLAVLSVMFLMSNKNALADAKSYVSHQESLVEQAKFMLEEDIEGRDNLAETLKKLEEDPDKVGRTALDKTDAFIKELEKLKSPDLLERRDYIKKFLKDYVSIDTIDEAKYEQLDIPENYELYVETKRASQLTIVLIDKDYKKDASGYLFRYDIPSEKIIGALELSQWGGI